MMRSLSGKCFATISETDECEAQLFVNFSKSVKTKVKF